MLKQPSSASRGFPTAGIRLPEEMLPALGALYASRTQPMQHIMHAFDKAHCVMLVEQGLMTRDVGVKILPWLRQQEHAGVGDTRGKVGGALHSGEQYLIRTLG